MLYTRIKIEKNQLIKKRINRLYLDIYLSKVVFYYNNTILKIFYCDIKHIRNYLKEVGLI